MPVSSIHKLLILLTAVAVCCGGSLSAQDELEILSYHTYVGPLFEEIYDHIQTSDGGYALLGSFSQYECPDGYSNMFLIRTDEHGDTLWTNSFGPDLEWLYGTEIIETDDGFLLFGYSTPMDDEDYALIIATDQNGDSLWSKRFGGEGDEEVHCAIELDDGYLLGGSTTSWGNGREDAWIIRLDENCDSLWSRNYGGVRTERIYSMAVTEWGDFILAGYTSSIPETSQDYMLIYVDENGDSLSTFIASSSPYNHDICRTITRISDTDFFISGAMGRAGEDGDMWSMGITDWGQCLWTRVDGERDSDQTTETSCLTSDERIAFSGYSPGYFRIIKVDSRGNLDFAQLFDGPRFTECKSIIQNRDGGYSLAGFIGRNYLEYPKTDAFHLITSPDPDFSPVNQQKPISPKCSCLYPAYPNPFNSSFTIPYRIRGGENCEIKVIDINGRVLFTKSLFSSNNELQSLSVNMNTISTGMYSIQLISRNNRFVQNIVHLK